MNIVVITQDDPFYLGKNLDFLFSNLPEGAVITGCVVSSVSPFGKRESFFDKAKKTASIFGFKFFLYYSIKYVLAKLNSKWRVENVLQRHRIPRIDITGSINSQDSLDLIQSYKPDLLISIAGNQIFKKPLIELAPQGCLNLHTALLPKYRGLMPSFWVLKNQEKETGVSVFFVDEGIDSGPILVQKRIPLTGQTQQELIKESKHLGMTAIIEAVEKIIAGDVRTVPNDDSKQSYFRFPTKEAVAEFRSAGAKFF